VPSSKIIKQLISRQGIVLDFSKASITDAGLVHLQGAHTIYLQGTNVTDAGIKYLNNSIKN